MIFSTSSRYVSGSQPGVGEEHRLGPDQEIVRQDDEAEEGGNVSSPLTW